MTQRIFDVENEKDMADLWDILPDGITKLTPTDTFSITSDTYTFRMGIIKIEWHYKTEITRPIQEATEADIGKLCYFWDDKKEDDVYGILEKIDKSGNDGYPFKYRCYWQHCRRLTKQEIEELC